MAYDALNFMDIEKSMRGKSGRNKIPNFSGTYKITCCGCGDIVRVQDCIETNSELFKIYDGHIPICKKCFEAYVENLHKYYSDGIDSIDGINPSDNNIIAKIISMTVKTICSQLNYFYSESLLLKILSDKKTNTGNIIKIWNCYADTCKIRFKGKVYSDCVLENNIAKLENSFSTVNPSNITMSDISDTTIKRFGTGFKAYQYYYLQQQYDDWTTRHECNTKSQEEIFKQICFAQLDIYEGRLNGEDVTKKVATFESLLDTAKLQPKQNHNEAISDAQTFGTLINKWEDTRPIAECDEKYKDVDDIAKYITAFFYGHTCKTVGIKNFYSKAYDDIIKEYTVNKPNYDDDETNEAIFDKIFNKVADDESIKEMEEENDGDKK